MTSLRDWHPAHGKPRNRQKRIAEWIKTFSEQIVYDAALKMLKNPDADQHKDDVADLYEVAAKLGKTTIWERGYRDAVVEFDRQSNPPSKKRMRTCPMCNGEGEIQNEGE